MCYYLDMDTHLDMKMDLDTGLILTKKTTILFSPDLYDRLTRLAKQRRTSVGELVREACRAQYCLSSSAERLALVDQLAHFSLPVGTPEEMERESVAAVEPLT
jgi:hypothetical protein